MRGRWDTLPLASPEAMRAEPPTQPEPEQEGCVHFFRRLVVKECAEAAFVKLQCIYCHKVFTKET